jgi:hypothetical protein
MQEYKGDEKGGDAYDISGRFWKVIIASRRWRICTELLKIKSKILGGVQ